MLIELGAYVNLTDQCGWSPLHEACFCGNLKIIKMLLKAGADPHQIMRGDIGDGRIDRRTPLDIAVKEGREDVVEFLRELG